MQRRVTTTTATSGSNTNPTTTATTTTKTATSTLSSQQQQLSQQQRQRTIRKKRRSVDSWQYRLARLIEEDGAFFVLVVCMGCFLILVLLLLLYRLLSLWDFVGGGGRYHHRSRGLPLEGNFPGQHETLPFDSVYRIPEAMEIVGDRSTRYAKLRLKYDTEILPLNPERSMRFVQSLPHLDISPKPIPAAATTAAAMAIHHSDQVDTADATDTATTTHIPYDIYNCPFAPPPGYPYEWNLVQQVLKSWPVDETDHIPTEIHQGLCVFDFQKDYAKAMNYRTHELPFVVTNDPEVARTVERWHQPGYVEQMVGPDVKHRTEYNTNNHFLYAMPQPGNMRRGKNNNKMHLDENIQDSHGRKAELQNKAAIPQAMRMAFTEWLHHANTTNNKHVGPNDEHWYYRLIACGFLGSDGDCDHGSTEALFDEMPFFQPRPGLYLGEPEEQKGIHCRFGMKGVIAENHFDGSRNAIALLYGRRRYILAHPKNCDSMALLPKEHASARHSAVDYSNPDLQTYPEFLQAKSNEVVLEPGQVLYLPTNWFHYIVSLELNFQCNTRSGLSNHYMKPIRECGF